MTEAYMLTDRYKDDINDTNSLKVGSFKHYALAVFTTTHFKRDM